MVTIEPARSATGVATGLTREEQRSITHGDFWIPEEEREKYKRVLGTLNRHGIQYVVSGAYAIYEHTGIYRETRDLDLFLDPRHIVHAAEVLREEGFRTRLEQPHWLAKAMLGDHFVDLIFGMGNGLAMIDEDWYRYSRPAILAAHQVRVAPVEDLIWHRLFISERHRQDTADILHLILCQGHRMDWDRLLAKTGDDWPLLMAQLHLFAYVYPEARSGVPEELIEDLLDRSRRELRRDRSGDSVTRGPLISRFSFNIDVNEWGMRDLREESIRQMEVLAPIQELATAEVWDERSEMALAYLHRYSR